MSDNPFFFNSDPDIPSRADAVQNRSDILCVARQLFRDLGIENVSMSQIAREAKVGKGTLYRHFRNKPDLAIALLDDDQRLLQNNTLSHIRNSTDSPAQQLEWFLAELCDFTARNLDFLCEARSGRLAESEAVSLSHPAHHWQWQTILGLMRQINPEADVEYFATVIYIMVDAETYRFLHDAQQYSHERIVHGIISTAQKLLGD